MTTVIAADLSLGDVVGALVTLVVGFASVFFAYNYRRQLALRAAERRIDAYGALWTAMHVARPTRKDINGEVITAAERRELEAQMSLWYFTGGSGMLLTQDTRQMYFANKRNLVCADVNVTPAVARDQILEREGRAAREWARGELAMRQLSLLRTQMKADLDIYGRVYGEKLGPTDIAFIRACGLDPGRRPWRPSRLDRLRGRKQLSPKGDENNESPATAGLSNAPKRTRTSTH
jgi:hypothetical protein